MNDVLQLIEQLLGAAYTERRHQYGALVLERFFDHGLQTLASIGPTLVIAIAIGTFQYQDILAAGGLGWRQQGRMRRAQPPPREQDTLVLPRSAVEHVHLDISRTEDMTGTLQTDPGMQRGVVIQGEPDLARR